MVFVGGSLPSSWSEEEIEFYDSCSKYSYAKVAPKKCQNFMSLSINASFFPGRKFFGFFIASIEDLNSREGKRRKIHMNLISLFNVYVLLSALALS